MEGNTVTDVFKLPIIEGNKLYSQNRIFPLL